MSTGKAASGATVSVYGGASLGVTGGDGTLEINSGIDVGSFLSGSERRECKYDRA